MFCNRCGKENRDEAAFCGGCGADLAPMKQAAARPAAVPGQESRGRKIFSLVLYMVCGGTAIYNMLLPLLPQVIAKSKGTMNFVQIFIHIMENVSSSGGTGFFGGNNEAAAAVTFFFISFVIIAAFYVTWAILSFTRRRSAGGWGIASNTLMLLVSFIWTVMLNISAKDSSRMGLVVTAVPYLMMFSAVEGVAFGIVQLVFRDTVRKKLTVAQKAKKTQGAKVLYWICAGCGALNALMMFLPTLEYRNDFGIGVKAHPFSMIQFFLKASDGTFEKNTKTVAVMFIIGTLLLIAWAVLSFMKLPFAGGIGIVASLTAVIFPSVYCSLLYDHTKPVYVDPGTVYGLVLFLSLAGFVLAIIQQVKWRRV